MCGRYTQAKRARDSVLTFGIEANPAARSETWNLAPRTLSLIVRKLSSGLSADWLTWGLNVGANLCPINARIESAAAKPFFRESWKTRRCIVPAEGWYEWTRDKQPYYFYRQDNTPIFFAGLWCNETFALLTTSASGEIGQIHDRRPLTLKAEFALTWIEGPSPDVNNLQLQLTEINFHPVNPKVNSSKINSPDLVEPWAPAIIEPVKDLFSL